MYYYIYSVEYRDILLNYKNQFNRSFVQTHGTIIPIRTRLTTGQTSPTLINPAQWLSCSNSRLQAFAMKSLPTSQEAYESRNSEASDRNSEDNLQA